MDKAAQKRVTRACVHARKAATDPALAEIHLRRFHRAMDDLQSREEGEAVYDTLRSESWYREAADALARTYPQSPPSRGETAGDN